jgi:acyl-CoA hydrolase
MDHVNGVGFIDLASGAGSHRAAERHPKTVETIKIWAAANGYDAAIWTALASNFHELAKANAPFSIEAAVRFLESQDAIMLDAALNYIRQAPAEVQTPVRAAVNTRWPEG